MQIPAGYTQAEFLDLVRFMDGDTDPDTVANFLKDCTVTCDACGVHYVNAHETQGIGEDIKFIDDNPYCENCHSQVEAEYRFDAHFDERREYGTLWAYNGSVVG